MTSELDVAAMIESLDQPEIDYKTRCEILEEELRIKKEENAHLLTFVDQFKKKEYCEGGQSLARTVKHLNNVHDMALISISALKQDKSRYKTKEARFNTVLETLNAHFEHKIQRILDIISKEETKKAVLSIASGNKSVAEINISNKIKLDKALGTIESQKGRIANLEKSLAKTEVKVEGKAPQTQVQIPPSRRASKARNAELASGRGDFEIKEDDMDTISIFSSVTEITEAIPNFLSYKRLSNKMVKPVGRFAIFMNPQCSMVWSRVGKCFDVNINNGELFSSFFAALKQAYFIRKKGYCDGEMYIREVNCSIYDVENYAFRMPKGEDVSEQMNQYISTYGKTSEKVKRQVDKQMQQMLVLENFFGGDDNGWSW